LTSLLLAAAIAAAVIAPGAPAADTAPTTRATTQPAAAATQPAAGVPAAPLVRRLAINAVSARAQRDGQRQSIRSLPDGGSFKMDDLARFVVADGRLQCEWVADKFPNGQARRIRVDGSDATWLVNRFNAGPNAYYNITRYDFDAPETEFWMTQFSFQEGVNVLTVYAQGGEACEVSRLFFTQQASTATLNLSGVENNRLRQILIATAPDLYRLRNDHPDEIRRFLIPLLRKVTLQPILRPGAADVYRVFHQIPAPTQATATLVALLPGLASADPDVRDRSSAALRAMGPAGALAALRFDPDLLVPEQANRLAALVALHSRVSIDDPSAAATDPAFLLDCFEDDDPVVRAAAKAALERVLHQPVELDVSAPLDQRTAAADAIRLKLAKDPK
jgi:hypothetical protein